MTASHSLPWTEANQALLVAELARVKAQLLRERGGECDEHEHEHEHIDDARAKLAEPAALDRLCDAFALSPFERDVLLLAAGVELDASFGAACAGASGTGRPFATFALALAKLAEPHWSALTPVRPLRRFRLLELKEEHALTTGRLGLDERVLHYLTGLNYLDPRLGPHLRLHGEPQLLADTHGRAVDSILGALQPSEDVSLIELVGDDPRGQRDVAGCVARALGLDLHVLRAADIPTGLHELEALSVLWHREAVLLGSALFIEHGSRTTDGPFESSAVARLAERAAGVVFLASAEPLPHERLARRFRIDKPPAGEQKRLWELALGPAASSSLNGALDGVAMQFRLSAETIFRTGQELKARPLGDALDHALWQACRGSVRSRLDDLAQRVDTRASWDDLVLPKTQEGTLREIAAQVRHRSEVYERWGFAAQGARGLGVSALFAGDSGTGKTLAAEVLANHLHLDLYRIDLSSTVSKYIGETEKNLRRIFDAAEDSGSILLFDEADALFGKRSEVKDGRDRYANLEVSYLLQRMETYRGLAILTTNQKSALDSAFQRRLRFIIQFPFPSQEQRERIWRRIFPTGAPLAGLDYTKLARLNVAGGNIRNIALNAAFLAAEQCEPVGMAHLLQAARSEGQKRERPFSELETRGWS